MTTTKQEPAAPLARVCSWCSQPLSEADRLLVEAGAMITHGIDPVCLARWFPELSEATA